MRTITLVVVLFLPLVMLWAGLEAGYRIGRHAEATDHRTYINEVVNKGDR